MWIRSSFDPAKPSESGPLKNEFLNAPRIVAQVVIAQGGFRSAKTGLAWPLEKTCDF